jgi:hypothetical protein
MPEKGQTEKRWAAVLGGPFLSMDEGVLPSWTYGLGLGVGVRFRRFKALLAGALWLPQTTNANSYQASYMRRTGEVLACNEWAAGAFELGPCVALALEDVTARGTGQYVTPHSAEAIWLTVGLGASARWSPRPWTSLFVRPRLAFSTTRPTFEIDGVGPLHQVPPVTVGVDIGCEWFL